MDILYFQGVRPFRLGGKEPAWTSFTSKGYDPLGWGGRNHHGHPLLPRGTTLWVGGGTIMDILYFQGVRPFRLGEEEPAWTSFTSKGYDPLGWGGRKHHGHPLLPRGTTL